MNSPAQVLTNVAKIVRDRGETHGDFREVFELTAQLWSVYLGMPVSPQPVCALNSLQKLSRDQVSDTAHRDNFMDVAGYAAIGVALQSNR